MCDDALQVGISSGHIIDREWSLGSEFETISARTSGADEASRQTPRLIIMDILVARLINTPYFIIVLA